ncbi:long-chain N-acyl amino acid synthase [Paucibacter sp. DJ1R-11]|nr:long-chain N-acyl amino acid synthase [Paucibacter sp. DJ1R-11]
MTFESPHKLQSLLPELLQSEAVGKGLEINQRLFKIRNADSSGRRSSASVLIQRRYASRGYIASDLPEEAEPQRITLMASDAEVIIGTITIGFDSPAGLNVDETFGPETDALRAERRNICEFTKLAVDNVSKSKRVLASLFHVAYIYAHRLMGFDSLLIEVNPRHVRFYEAMLGFKVLTGQRQNPRVNAPAVLMCLDFSYVQEQIATLGGQPEKSLEVRSLYPYFLSIAEEANIVGRLSRAHQDIESLRAATSKDDYPDLEGDTVTGEFL